MSTYETGRMYVATVRGVPNVRVFNFGAPTIEWISGVSVKGTRVHGPGDDVTDVRPLVVIDLDPNNADFVVDVLREARHRWTHDVADQIEAQTKPPKPAEPTGDFAAVEDADDALYFRLRGNLKRPWLRAGTDNCVGWSEIDATPVRVLSEGVQP